MTDLPKVAYVCPTFRNEDHPETPAYKIREAGVVSLYEQILAQDYPQDRIELRIIDSSASPHQDLMYINDPRFKYLHIPNRRKPSKQLLDIYPEIKEFLLDDNYFHSKLWRQRISYLHSYCSRRMDPKTEQMVPSIADPLNSHILPIGMMRNIGSAINFHTGGNADILIAADDDDYRGSQYTNTVVSALRDADWTKIASYYLNIFVGGNPNEQFWGIRQIPVKGIDDKGDPIFQLTGKGIEYDPKRLITDNCIIEEDARKLFTSPRWPLISTDGCVHAMRYSAWRRAADFCGGFAPVSYNEDHLMYAALKMLGNFEKPHTRVHHEVLIGGLVGDSKFSARMIKEDAAKGAVRFNPHIELTDQFVRLGGLNTSSVQFKKVIPIEQVPTHLHNCFRHYIEPLNGLQEMPHVRGPHCRFPRERKDLHA